MNGFLQFLQLGLGVLLMIAVLVQSRSSGLSSGGASSNFQIARRGAEKVVYNATILFAVMFVTVSIAVNYIR